MTERRKEERRKGGRKKWERKREIIQASSRVLGDWTISLWVPIKPAVSRFNNLNFLSQSRHPFSIACQVTLWKPSFSPCAINHRLWWQQNLLTVRRSRGEFFKVGNPCIKHQTSLFLQADGRFPHNLSWVTLGFFFFLSFLSPHMSSLSMFPGNATSSPAWCVRQGSFPPALLLYSFFFLLQRYCLLPRNVFTSYLIQQRLRRIAGSPAIKMNK